MQLSEFALPLLLVRETAGCAMFAIELQVYGVVALRGIRVYSKGPRFAGAHRAIP